MKETAPNKNRVRRGFMGTTDEDGMNGRFVFERAYNSGSKVVINVIVSDGKNTGWEHVSLGITTSKRCPTWDEMCFIKDQFWNDDETVVQFHPKKSEHVNDHPYVLHMWRKVGTEHELPPIILV